MNQNNIENGILRKRRNLKPLYKVINIFLAKGAIISHKNLDGERQQFDNGLYSISPDYSEVEDVPIMANLYRKNENRQRAVNANPRRRIIEQYDLKSGKLLRRYRCMADACSAMELPGHYLSYKVFGGGARLHTCVFGWRESQDKDALLEEGEEYADIIVLKSYLKRYLGVEGGVIPSFEDFSKYFHTGEYSEEPQYQHSCSSGLRSRLGKKRKGKVKQGLKNGDDISKFDSIKCTASPGNIGIIRASEIGLKKENAAVAVRMLTTSPDFGPSDPNYEDFGIISNGLRKSNAGLYLQTL